MERIRKIYGNKNRAFTKKINIPMCDIRQYLNRIQHCINDFLLHIGDEDDLISKMYFPKDENGRQDRVQMKYLTKELAIVSQIILWMNAIVGDAEPLILTTDLNGKKILLFKDRKRISQTYIMDVLFEGKWHTVQIISANGDFEAVDLYDESVVIKNLDGLLARKRIVF